MKWPEAFLIALAIVCATILVIMGHAHVLGVVAVLVFAGFVFMLLS